MSIVHDRAAAATATADRIKELGLSSDADLTPDKVAQASRILAELAAQKHLFPIEHFPQIRPGLSGFYRLIEDADGDNSLVVAVSSIDFVMSGLHSHAGWALIAGVAGTEYNHLYDRDDDHSVEGKGQLRKARDVALQTGEVLFIPRGQLHTVAYDGGEPAINLHFYGKSTDNPEGAREFFTSADATDYVAGPGRERSKGIPKIGATEFAAALAHGPLEVLVLDQGKPPANFAGNWPAQNPGEVSATGEPSTPIVLVGEKPAVQAAADRLVRDARRPILHASYDDAYTVLRGAA